MAQSSLTSSRAGICELQLRKKLLQQQLELVSNKCNRMTAVLEKKGEAQARGHDRGADPLSHPKNTPARRPRNTFYGLEHASTHDAHHTAAARIGGAQTFPPGSVIDNSRKRELIRKARHEWEHDKAAREAAAAAKAPVQRRGAGAAAAAAATPSRFPGRYAMGDIPCSIDSGDGVLVWVCPLQQLDYHYYLPLFLDGIRCTADPCKMLARQGLLDLLSAATGTPERVVPLLKDIAMALRNACLTDSQELVAYTCKVLETLVGIGPEVGLALVPHYKAFLSLLNKHINDAPLKNAQGKEIGHNRKLDLSVLIEETLQMLERSGGSGVFAVIKHAVPTYMTCL
ncbi:parkin co-regulated protein-domain-containing protein [Tribonema minus]|uniref:Parkin co-regulated protein-domain-containing protein n=1 Tax=Tribonema minus TaxID=303371 RepID=A0A835YJW5_9STRA|nr:parkin co-regulated protein-domain-containing protein [Tribonema minus]